MSNWNKRLFSAVICLLSLLVLAYVGKRASLSAAGVGVNGDTSGICVVLDPGHGGIDPGKIGINGAKEKDINLQITERVKEYLEANDVRVVMTREDDEGLYDAGTENKKVQDMKRRIALIDETAPRVTVSIHQNSYPQESIHGAQVFYYTGSADGRKLAEKIQKSLVQRVEPENRRQVKENSSYYLLKKTGLPIVIVECGFLSNSAEAEKLCSEEYQDRVAWAVCMGIMQYLLGEGA